jgi:hypothetical protein
MPSSDRTLWRTIWKNAVTDCPTSDYKHYSRSTANTFCYTTPYRAVWKNVACCETKSLWKNGKNTWRWCNSVEDHTTNSVTWMVTKPNHRSGGYISSFTSEFPWNRPETITVTAASSTKGIQEQITPPTIQFVTEQQNHPTSYTDLNE